MNKILQKYQTALLTYASQAHLNLPKVISVFHKVQTLIYIIQPFPFS
jgi:hypothetical protein